MIYTNLNIAAGQLVTFSEGEYSDYGYKGTFVTLQPLTEELVINLQATINAEYQAEDDREGYVDWEPKERLVAELIKYGHLLQVDTHEIHLGSYGRLEII